MSHVFYVYYLRQTAVLGQAANKQNQKMNNKENKYEAPELEIVEVVLENGIAYTLTKGGAEIDLPEEGDGWGTY